MALTGASVQWVVWFVDHQFDKETRGMPILVVENGERRPTLDSFDLQFSMAKERSKGTGESADDTANKEVVVPKKKKRRTAQGVSWSHPSTYGAYGSLWITT